MTAGRDDVGGGGRDELAERRRERVIERTRLAMVEARKPENVVARANANVARARRALKKGARELLAGGYVARAPGTCAATGVRNGLPCTAKAVEGGLCREHLAAAERQEARRAAAEARRSPEPAKARTEAADGRTGPEAEFGPCRGWVSSKNRQCRVAADGPDGWCVHHRR